MSFMKNKNSLYILAPFVLLVWGLIFYRAFLGKEKPMVAANYHLEGEDGNAEETNFTLLLNYETPFFRHGFDGGRIDKDSVQSTQNQLLQTMPTQPALPAPPIVSPPYKWPSIQYHGKLKVDNKVENIALISIDGKFHKIRPGFSINDIFLTAIWDDSLRLTHKTNSITVKKTKN